MLNYDYCIWDFNGTILDDVDLGICVINKLLSVRGLPTVTREEYRRFFDFPIIDYYKLLGFDLSSESYDSIAKEWVGLYNEGRASAKIFPDLVKALDFFENNGVKQSVLSASEQRMLSSQLCELGLLGRFEEALGIDSIYGDSKLKIAKGWREKHPYARVMFIGDTTHDCETAEVLSADCFIVTSGHHSPERFAEKNAKIFSSLDELVEFLKN